MNTSLSICGSNKGISDFFTINSHVHAATVWLCGNLPNYDMHYVILLYCFFKNSVLFMRSSLKSFTISTPQVQEWCCKGSVYHPQLACSYRSRYDLLQHIVALSGCWKHFLSFELQKPWQICHCIVFFANVSIRYRLSTNLLWFSQEIVLSLLPGQSLVLLWCLFSWDEAFFISRGIAVADTWLSNISG